MPTNAIFEFERKRAGKKTSRQPMEALIPRVVRAVLYARVSRDEQSKDGKVSLDQQLDRCREYAERMDMEIVMELREDYTGTKPRRPEMDIAMRAFSEGQADALIVMTNDRFHRSVPTFYILWEELRSYGAELHFADVGRVDENNLGNLILVGVQNVMSEGERNKIVKRMVDAKHDMARRLKVPMMSTPAYGLKKIGKHQLALDEERAKVVKDIFRWMCYGIIDNGEFTSTRSIALWLTKNHAPNALGNNGKPKSGAWTTGMVHKIIVNPIYCGHYYYGQTKVIKERRVEVPPEEWKEIILPSELRIVDETTWRVANERLKENRHKSKRPFKVQYLLHGHVYCGSCGRHARASIAGLPIRDHNDQIIGYYRRYGCTSVNRRVETMLGNACPNQNRTISANIVESAVTEWLRQLFENPDDVQAGIERMAHMRVEEQDPLLKKIDATRAAIATQQLYISELLESLAVFKNNKRLKAECEQKIFMADATRQELEEKLADYEREFGHTTASIANLSYLYDLAPVILEKMEAGPTYDNLRWIVEALDLKVTLFIDPGDPRNRWIEVKCVFTPASYYRLLYAKKTDGEGHEGPFSMEQLGLKNTPAKMGESV